jgi:hypothetical protein
MLARRVTCPECRGTRVTLVHSIDRERPTAPAPRGFCWLCLGLGYIPVRDHHPDTVQAAIRERLDRADRRAVG